MERRRGHDGRLELAVALDREERPEEGHAAHEVVGPVDRVDVPAGRGGAGLGAVLLADQAVLRPGRADPRPDRPLDRGVHLGHERPVGLGRDLQVAPERRSGHGVCLVAGVVGKGEPRVELGVGCPAQAGAPLGPVGA